jgi:hypothetical protein
MQCVTTQQELLLLQKCEQNFLDIMLNETQTIKLCNVIAKRFIFGQI